MNTVKKILLILGTLIVIFFVFVDYLGIGDPGFGHRQIIGAGIGVIIVIISLIIKKRV